MPSAESLAGLEIPTLQGTGQSGSALVNPTDVVDPTDVLDPAPTVVKCPAKQRLASIVLSEKDIVFSYCTSVDPSSIVDNCLSVCKVCEGEEA